jgi:hypothetical protein
MVLANNLRIKYGLKPFNFENFNIENYSDTLLNINPNSKNYKEIKNII